MLTIMSVCVCSAFMLQRFGTGGEAGYWVKIVLLPLGIHTIKHKRAHTLIFDGLTDGHPVCYVWGC